MDVYDFTVMKINHSGVPVDSIAKAINMSKSVFLEALKGTWDITSPFVAKIRDTIDYYRDETDPVPVYQKSTIREKSFNSESAVRARLNAIEKKREEWVRAQIFKAEQWIKKHKND